MRILEDPGTTASDTVERPDDAPDAETRHAEDGTVRTSVARGLRIRRVRLASVARISFVFFAVGYAATILTLVVLWNLMHWIGFIANLEDVITTSLGLDTFSVSGADLFGLAVVGFALLAIFGFVFSLLAAMIYNATGKLFGGLFLDTTVTRRRRRRMPRVRRRADR